MKQRKMKTPKHTERNENLKKKDKIWREKKQSLNVIVCLREKKYKKLFAFTSFSPINACLFWAPAIQMHVLYMARLFWSHKFARKSSTDDWMDKRNVKCYLKHRGEEVSIADLNLFFNCFQLQILRNEKTPEKNMKNSINKSICIIICLHHLSENFSFRTLSIGWCTL